MLPFFHYNCRSLLFYPSARDEHPSGKKKRRRRGLLFFSHWSEHPLRCYNWGALLFFRWREHPLCCCICRGLRFNPSARDEHPLLLKFKEGPAILSLLRGENIPLITGLQLSHFNNTVSSLLQEWNMYGRAGR